MYNIFTVHCLSKLFELFMALYFINRESLFSIRKTDIYFNIQEENRQLIERLIKYKARDAEKMNEENDNFLR